MSRYYLIPLTLILLVLHNSMPIAASPPPAIEWSINIGGQSRDEGWSVIQTADGGYAVTGITWSYGDGDSDVFLAKVDSDGMLIWNRSLGSKFDDMGNSLVETDQGNLIITGYTEVSGRSLDLLLFSVDSSGNMLWNTTFGGILADNGQMIKTTSDRSLIISGFTSYNDSSNDLLLLQTGPTGAMIWNRSYGGANMDRGESVYVTSDGGFLISGTTWSNTSGANDIYIVKTDSEGYIQWSQVIGGRDVEYGYNAVEMNGGGFAVFGFTGSVDEGGRDLLIVRLNPEGVVLWNRTLGISMNEWCYHGEPTKDGGFILTGFTSDTAESGWGVYLVKTDELGELLWEMTFGSGTGTCVKQTQDGGYIMTGTQLSGGYGGKDVRLVKLASDKPVVSINPDTMNTGPFWDYISVKVILLSLFLFGALLLQHFISNKII